MKFNLLLSYQPTHYYDTSNIWMKSELIIIISKRNKLIKVKPKLTLSTNTWINILINKLLSRLSLMEFEMCVLLLENIETITDIILDILRLIKLIDDEMV